MNIYDNPASTITVSTTPYVTMPYITSPSITPGTGPSTTISNPYIYYPSTERQPQQLLLIKVTVPNNFSLQELTNLNKAFAEIDEKSKTTNFETRHYVIYGEINETKIEVVYSTIESKNREKTLIEQIKEEIGVE